MRAATIEELAEAPIGRYVAGKRYLHFCADAGLWGIVLWGRPGEDVARQLGRSLVLELRPEVAPHGSLIDASRLEGADPTAFRALEWYLRHYAEPLAEKVTRLGLVRPSGIEGAIVAGIYDVVVRPYPVEVFDRLDAALAWLGAPPGLGVTLAELYARVSSTPPLLGALHALLDARLHDITLAAVASALGVSERSLQRKLGEAGTTFQQELARTRIRAAQRLMRDTDLPLTNIAIEVGCASLQHFSALFRKHVGASPSHWRSRRNGES